MHCLRTALVLAAAVAMCQAALGQTNTAFHVIKNPAQGIAAASPSLASTAPPCNATLCKQIKRYTDTAIIEATEYYYYSDGTCQFKDPGNWSSPNDIMPNDGTPAGTVTFSVIQDTPPPNPYTGQTCIGGGPYQYAQLHFTWQLHKNLTVVRGYGPTASFSSEWTGTLGGFIDETFEISVPVVHPIGETSNFTGFFGSSVSKWRQSLQCCDAGNNGQTQFDFVGDCVKERIYSVAIPLTIPTNFGLTTISTPCPGSEPGPGANSQFHIESMSQYTDYIGLINAGTGPFPKACIDFSLQSMYFKSQAESAFSSTPYSHNQLKIAETSDQQNAFDAELFFSRSTSPSPIFSMPSISGRGSPGGFHHNVVPYTQFTRAPYGQDTSTPCGD